MTFIDGVLSGFSAIGSSVAKDWSILWIMITLFGTWIIVMIYLGRFKYEEESWLVLLSHTVALIWITFDSIRFIFFEDNAGQVFTRLIVLLGMFAYVIIVIMMIFAHRNYKIVRHLSNPTTVSVLAMSAVLISNGNLDLTFWTAMDLLIIFGIAIVASYFMRKFLPESDVEVKEIEEELAEEEREDYDVSEEEPVEAKPKKRK